MEATTFTESTPLPGTYDLTFLAAVFEFQHAAAALIVVVALAIGALILLGGRGQNLNPERIAVAPLVNRTGDAEFDTYGRWAATTITQGLQRVGVGEVVPSSFIDESLQAFGDLTGEVGWPRACSLRHGQ